jgi:hypothetical protein
MVDGRLSGVLGASRLFILWNFAPRATTERLAKRRNDDLALLIAARQREKSFLRRANRAEGAVPRPRRTEIFLRG